MRRLRLKQSTIIHICNLIGFISVIVAIVILAQGDKGADLAIMTGLVGVLGTFKPWSHPPTDDAASGKVDDPVHVEEDQRHRIPPEIDPLN